MKNTRLFLAIILLLSGLSFAQKNKETKIVIKDKKGNIVAGDSYENQPHFIQFGIMSRNHENFRKKYRIDIVYQNCVISPLLSKQAKENNLAVAKLLTQKYGDVWKKDLGITPYGL